MSMPVSKITAIIGRNDIGKSSILDALDIFFNDSKIEQEDACKSGDASDVTIICEFEDMPRSLIIDADYATTLAQEHLLNQNGRLEIHKKYNCSIKTIKPVIFACAYHPTSVQYDDLLTLKITELKQRAQDLHVDLSETDRRVATLIRQKIWQNAPDELIFQNRLIEINSEILKAIYEQLKKCFPCFALFRSDRASTDQDAEAQDPMMLAAKEAVADKQEQLTEISNYVTSKVKDIADTTVEKLREMDPSLAQQMNPNCKPPEWHRSFKFSLTDESAISLNKRGSGVRRLVLINFFRAKVEKQAGGLSNIIYAIEEPETSQHPANQKLLMTVFTELTQYGRCQILLTTHTPVMAKLLPTDAIRFISTDGQGDRAIYTSDDVALERATKSLGVLPDHNVRLFIGVEGPNDIEFLRNISGVLMRAGENVCDLCDMENRGMIMFIPLGGSNVQRWTSRLAGLNIPEYYIFDRDEVPPQQPHYINEMSIINARPRCQAVHTNKREIENYIHADAISRAFGIQINPPSDYDDVPEIVARKVHELAGGDPWDTLDDEKKDKKCKNAKRRLNLEAARLMTPNLLTQIDPNNEIRSWLSAIKRLIEQ